MGSKASIGGIGLAVLAGCLLPSTDGLTGADGGSDAPIGCIDCADSGIPDVAADTRNDAVTTDAVADAPGDSAPVAFCAGLSPKPVFCEDFDSNGLFNAQFTNVHVTSKASIGPDTVAYASAPRSLLAQLPVAVTNTDYAFLTRILGGTPTELDYAFDVRIDSFTAAESSVLASLILGEGTAVEHAMVVVSIDGDFYLEESFLTDAGRIFKDTLIQTNALPKGTWVRVGMHVSTVTHQAKAYVGGQVVKTFPIDAAWTAALPQIDLGFTYVAKQTSAWSAHFDNVVYDAK